MTRWYLQQVDLAVPVLATPCRAMPVRYAVCFVMIMSCLTGCTGDSRTEAPPSTAEQLLIERITRDPFVIIAGMERDDFDHLIVTTRQGNGTVRYVIRPVAPGDERLSLQRLNDRSQLEVSESDQLGTFNTGRR